jgi:ABC-type nitrate/sulfonate/bicarbonate transport system ATPase subunit
LGDRVLVLSTQPAKLIDDFAIEAPQPRAPGWVLRAEVRAWHDRVVEHLRAAGAKGQVRVSL